MYRAGGPVPLVLVFHGGGGRASGIAPHTGFSRLAEREGFVAVYPDGLERRWNDGRGYAATHDDVGFVRALLDTLERELSIDPRRVYSQKTIYEHAKPRRLYQVTSAFLQAAARHKWPSKGDLKYE